MCGKFTFQLESCKLGVFAVYFSNIYPGTLLEASCQWQHPCPLWTGGAGNRLWSSCSYRKCPQVGSTFLMLSSVNSVQSLARVQLFETPWIAARQASLSITNSRSLLILTSIELVMPSSCLVLYCPLLLLPSIFPSIKFFSNGSVLHIRCPKSSALPMNTHDWFPLVLTSLIL